MTSDHRPSTRERPGLLADAWLSDMGLPAKIGAQSPALRTGSQRRAILASMPRSNFRRFGFLGLVASALLGPADTRGEAIGAALLPWSPGTLDIHHINTGRGNATLLVLPDGTTLLVDAGDGGNPPPRGTPPRPDGSRTPAEWIARYLRAMGVSALDYGYVTHFHADHMGAMPELARRIPVRTMVDRGWPDYAFPAADHAEFKT